MNLASQPQHGTGEASDWVCRFVPLIRCSGTVLDLACGSGRHARRLAADGFLVDAVDRDAASLATLAGIQGVRTIQADLEEEDWPLRGRQYDAVIVTNYLYRPHFADLLDLVGPDGVLIYETFMRGNERFGRPSRPAFLLEPDELLERVRGRFAVVAFEQGEIAIPKPAVVQRVCAVRDSSGTVFLPESR